MQLLSGKAQHNNDESMPCVQRTFRLQAAFARVGYFAISTVALTYLAGTLLTLATQKEHDWLWRLLSFVPFAGLLYAIFRWSKTYVSFQEDYFMYFGGLLKRRVPWDRVQQILVRQFPSWRITVVYVGVKKRALRIDIGPEQFSDGRDLVEEFTKVAENKGIRLQHLEY